MVSNIGFGLKEVSQSGMYVFEEDLQVEATSEFRTEVTKKLKSGRLQDRLQEGVNNPTLVHTEC